MRHVHFFVLLAALGASSAASAATLPFAREGGGPKSPLHLIDQLRNPNPLNDVYVVPQRPGKNRVRWYGFDFRELLLPQLPGAGVKLFFYEAETPAARVAASIIRDEYLRLARAFDYVPERVVPYVLYATNEEFQSTNTFDISEGVLGVTSPIDLTLALPFFGDLDEFRHTSTHELSHEFSIQLIRSAAEKADRSGGVGGFPLWFIEGLAEYAAYGGMDPEAQPTYDDQAVGAAGPLLPGLDAEGEGWARDLLYHSDPMEGFLLLGFYSDVPQGYVHTYKLGQVRLAFLGSTFGRDMVLWLLKNASYMGMSTELGEGVNFPKLVQIATGFEPPIIERMFGEWLRRRYLPAYEKMRTRVPAVSVVDGLPTETESVVASPDGKTLLVRGFDRELGETSLWFLDAEKPKHYQELARDSRRGLESLHVLAQRTFALTNDQVAWLGRSGPGDVLHVAQLRRTNAKEGAIFILENERKYDLPGAGLIQAGDPTFSPDGKTLAFEGIGDGGFADVYILPLDTGLSGLKRLTHTVYNESDLQWAPEGIYLASDASPTGKNNLFLMDPRSGDMKPVVVSSDRMLTPVPTKDGLLFASDRGHRWDLFRKEGDTVYRLTDVNTMIKWPAPGPNGSVFGIMIHGGHFRLVNVPAIELQRQAPFPALPPGMVKVEPIAVTALDFPGDPPRYEPFEHFGIDAGAIAVGTQSVAFGGLSFSDLLRDRLVAIQLAVYGSVEFTDASILYLDRAQHTTWIGGVFHSFQPKRDRVLPEPIPGDPDFYLEREFGVVAGLSRPLSTFERVDAEFTVEGVSRSRFTDNAANRGLPPGLPEWERLAGGSEPQLLASVNYGLDTIRYHPLAGPISGNSLTLTLGGGVLPQRIGSQELPHQAFQGWVEGDGEHYFYLGGRSIVWTRAAGGAGFGSVFSKQFYLSSVDNLQGFHFGDPRLLGTIYYVANVELSVPLDWLVRLAIFEGLRGVAGADFGGTSDNVDQLWDNRSLAGVLGVDFLAGPLALRLHFGYPIQIGPLLPADGWVTNLSLRLRY